MLLQQFFAFGCIGILIEHFFTGIWSVIHGDRRATTTSYLWSFPIYGLGGLQLQWLHDLGWHPILLALIYVPVIYVNEFIWGFALDKILGKCPWHYGRGKHTIMGYVHLYYAPFWFVLGLAFELGINWVQRALGVINTVL